MKITNNNNLPNIIVKAVEPKYRKSTNLSKIGVTTLIGSPRMAVLQSHHWDELEQDASEMMWSLLGDGVHKALEAFTDTEGENVYCYNEYKVSLEVEGLTITGVIDRAEVGDTKIRIIDYKVTSAYGYMKDHSDWESQLNIYLYMLKKHFTESGLHIDHMTNEISIICFIRDWTKYKTREEGYPDSPIKELKFIPWADDLTKTYISDRVAAHIDARAKYMMNEEMPECTPEETWYRPGDWAVWPKKDSKRPTLYPSWEEASKVWAPHISGRPFKVEQRAGRFAKCEAFCSANKWCSQWKKNSDSNAQAKEYILLQDVNTSTYKPSIKK